MLSRDCRNCTYAQGATAMQPKLVCQHRESPVQGRQRGVLMRPSRDPQAKQQAYDLCRATAEVCSFFTPDEVTL